MVRDVKRGSEDTLRDVGIMLVGSPAFEKWLTSYSDTSYHTTVFRSIFIKGRGRAAGGSSRLLHWPDGGGRRRLRRGPYPNPSRHTQPEGLTKSSNVGESVHMMTSLANSYAGSDNINN
ncbi:hypothetical protein EYF80_018925 [Liparis tanakae]|uniref:Uncharacterized protein n=1 Tax=Liparis tanakae TaxID=230148 RepID=A0A4Z2HYZ6_9TELE|nr:hypothetical protein EYF80_018925 [Liparis tanakae]